jgi:predicted dehydrogenase
MKTIGVAIIGCGGITLQNHVPGLAMCADTKIVALCDTDRACLEKASQQTGVKATSVDYLEIVRRESSVGQRYCHIQNHFYLA